MVDQRLLDYVKQQLQNGVLENDLKKILADTGWPQAQIDEAFLASKTPAAPAPNAAPFAGTQISRATVSPLTGTFKDEAATPAQPQGAATPQQTGPMAGAVMADAQIKTPDQSAQIQNNFQPPTEAAIQAQVDAALKAEMSQASSPEAKKELDAKIATPAAAPQAAEAVPSAPAAPAMPAATPAAQPLSQNQAAPVSQKELTEAVKDLPIASDPFPASGVGNIAAEAKKGPLAGTVGKMETVAGGSIAEKESGVAPGAENDRGLDRPEQFNEELEKAAEPEGGDGGRKGSKKGVLVAIILLFVLLLAGGGIYAYFVYFRNTGETPESVVEKSLVSQAQIKTAAFTGNLNVKGTNAEYNISYEGLIDATSADNPKSSTKFTLKGFRTTNDGVTDFGADVIGIGDNYYIRATKSSLSDDMSRASAWVKVSAAEYASGLDALIPGVIENNKINVAEDATLGQIGFLLALTEGRGSYTIKEKLADEDIAGTPCFHYAVTYKLGKASDDLEIWIGKDDHLLREVVLSADSISLDITFTAYGQEVSITAPDGAKSVNDVLAEAAADGEEQIAQEEGAKILQQDNQRTADMQSLFAAQKSWYVANKRFYTCGTKAGDCGGKLNNFPETIGSYLASALYDPLNSGTLCGQDFIYCGIDNTKYPKTFCYYAKLNDGSFVTASAYGNFKRASAPKTFKECQTGTSIEIATVAPAAPDAPAVPDNSVPPAAESLSGSQPETQPAP